MRNMTAALAVFGMIVPTVANASFSITAEPAIWEYRTFIKTQTDVMIDEKTGSAVIPSGPPPLPIISNPNVVGYTEASVLFLPGAGVGAFASTPYANVLSVASSDLFFEWRAVSPNIIDLSVFAPVVTVSGFVDIMHLAPSAFAFAAINVAPAFATFKDKEVDEFGSDTDPTTYRERKWLCGTGGVEQFCGTANFALRGMYSQLNPNTIGGLIYLRASAAASTETDVITGNFIGLQTSRAFIDPLISFDSAFLAAHPGLSISLSSGIPNATMAGAAVPEPATWAMMLISFGAVGVSLRSRRDRQAKPIAA